MTAAYGESLFEEDCVAGDKGGPWIAACAAVFHPLTRLLARRRFEGLENLPSTGPALLVCNHVSYLDPIYTAVFVHCRKRLPRFLAKDGLWRVPVVRQALDGTGQIPVYRNGPEAGQSLRAAEQALRAGEVVLIYPEGTITRDPGHWPMAGRTGVARLALTCDVPVLPVVHWGTQRVYDHYGRRFRPLPRTDVVVRAGAPLDLSAYRGRTPDRQLLHDITTHLMTAVRDLLAEVRGEQAPDTFFDPRRRGQDGEPAK